MERNKNIDVWNVSEPHQIFNKMIISLPLRGQLDYMNLHKADRTIGLVERPGEQGKPVRIVVNKQGPSGRNYSVNLYQITEEDGKEPKVRGTSM